MVADTRQNRSLAILIGVAALVIIIAGMRAATPILVPFLLAIFIAIISAPALLWFQAKGLSTGLALLVVITLTVGIVLVIAVLVGSSLDAFAGALPDYQARLREYMLGPVGWLREHGVEVSMERVRQAFDPGAVMRVANTMLSGLGGVLSNVFLILFTVVFILLEASSFPAKMQAAFPNADRRLGHLKEIIEGVKHYVALKTLISLATGLIVTLMLLLLGVDYPVLWGLLAFFLNYVPNIGSIFAAIPAVLVALLQLGFGSALLTATGYVVVNIVMGNIVEPRMMGRGVGLSTLVVFLSLLFWGWVLGPVGMLLSVPLTMMVKIVLEGSVETRWIAILLGSEATVRNDKAAESGEAES